MILTIKLYTSDSFRAIEKSICIINIYLKLSLTSPSHVTISNWVKKIGYYQITKAKEKAEDWVIIIDESIQIGSEKLLLILAIRHSKIDFTRALQFKDLQPVILVSKSGWNADKVMAEIKKAESILGKITYTVSDRGASIEKALKLLRIPHVHDITHRVANILKKIYKGNPEFELFTKNIANLRLKVQQSKLAYILPPQQRTQSRFLNLKPLTKWGLNALECMNQIHKNKKKDTTEEEIEKSLNWISENESLINELNEIIDAIEQIFTLVKSYGLNIEIIKKSKEILTNLKGKRSLMFSEELFVYFAEVLKVINDSESLSTVLCTSDIIESSFGKYKSNLSKRSINGITDLSLCIPALTCDLDENEIKKIFEETEGKTVKEWSGVNIGKSVLKQRMEFFSKYKKGVYKNFKKAS